MIMTKPKRIILASDISGLGKVAVTAALPLFAVCQLEVSVLPTVLLSSHTGGFPNVYIDDYTIGMQAFLKQWQSLEIGFSALVTGYLKSSQQIASLIDFLERENIPLIVDPIMADNGKLYAGVPESTIGLMRSLVECADYAVPNYTEACLLADTPIAEQITPDEARALVDAVRELGAKSVVITSAVVNGTNAVIGYDHVAGEYFTIPFELIPVYFPGTGDTFSAVLVGRVMAGWSLQRATSDAMRVVAELIERNADQEDKSAGLPIEACLDVIDHE